MDEGKKSTPLVEMRGITKRFSGVTANSDVNFSVEAGEVHALLGEHGAGKSTLMNVLYGLYAPDGGRIFVAGRPVTFRSPRDAIAAGIGMVHQNFMLVQTLTVWENMILGLKGTPFVLPGKKIQNRIAGISEQYGLEIDPRAAVWQLSTGERQRVAILQMLYRNARVLILDEPTAVLTHQEAGRLFRTIRRMTEEGHGVVFISHKMNEVMNETRRVTVLRGGKNAGAAMTAETTGEALAEMMMGRKVPLDLYRKPMRAGPAVFEADDLRALNDRGLDAVGGLSFHLRQNEILGVAGIAGNGQRELCEALVGLRALTGGTVRMGGANLTNASPRRFVDRGVRYIPGDRRGVGMAPGMDISSNAILRRYWSKPVASGAFIDWKRSEKLSRQIIRDFNVSAPSPRTPVRNLSGGNLQKFLMGRELSDSPKVVIVMHPTWGLDVAATRYVREQLLAQREAGAAILLISEDLDELLALSDRLAVLYRGRFMGILAEPEGVPPEKIGLMMAGTWISEALKDSAPENGSAKEAAS
ncbi:MAG: ABC transporter ATP-binding protein [Synergistaceae bacterium]|jgi:simple sugar transport system ATP-binding protein|nr:ABC transporter ATP-binding protein [Synergistaceae bacterium]